MTPKEALKEIFNGMSNNAGYIKEFKNIEKELTQPTADEVIKALCEYLEREVKISKEKSFYYSIIGHFGEVDEIICGYGWEDTHYTIGFEIDLPPRLITMIGKFYESLDT